jgi:membrane protease YdiL (CAAX protease family)
MSTNIHNGKDSGEEQVISYRKRQLVEVSAFLFLIIPSMVISFFVMKQGSMSFVLIAISTIMRDLALVSLILFFIWRNGEHLAMIGWSFKNVLKDAILGMWLFIPFFLSAGLIEKGLRMAGFNAPATQLPSLISGKNMAEFTLATLLVIVVAVAEETIFRGYLILRFKSITANNLIAVLLSSVIFSIGHGYEGSAGVITVGVMGIVFALVYLWRQSLVCPVVMHFLQDFIGIILLPLLGIQYHTFGGV